MFPLFSWVTRAMLSSSTRLNKILPLTAHHCEGEREKRWLHRHIFLYIPKESPMKGKRGDYLGIYSSHQHYAEFIGHKHSIQQWDYPRALLGPLTGEGCVSVSNRKKRKLFEKKIARKNVHQKMFSQKWNIL